MGSWVWTIYASSEINQHLSKPTELRRKTAHLKDRDWPFHGTTTSIPSQVRVYFYARHGEFSGGEGELPIVHQYYGKSNPGHCKRNGRTYIWLSSNTHLRVVSPRLKCFCTDGVPVAVSNSNIGAACQRMGFASVISISPHSVSVCGLRSQNYPYLLSVRHWHCILNRVRKQSE